MTPVLIHTLKMSFCEASNINKIIKFLSFSVLTCFSLLLIVGFFVKQNNYVAAKVVFDLNSKKIQFSSSTEMKKATNNLSKNQLIINSSSKSYQAKVANTNEEEMNITIYDDNLSTDIDNQNVYILVGSESVIWTILKI